MSDALLSRLSCLLLSDVVSELADDRLSSSCLAWSILGDERGVECRRCWLEEGGVTSVTVVTGGVAGTIGEGLGFTAFWGEWSQEEWSRGEWSQGEQSKGKWSEA